MNLPPIGEEAFLTCMILAIAAGALLGFALGYVVKEKRHAKEIAAILRIAKRKEEAVRLTAQKEGASKGPCSVSVRTPDGREYRAPRPLPIC